MVAFIIRLHTHVALLATLLPLIVPSATSTAAASAPAGACPYKTAPSYSSNPADTPEAFAAEVVRLVNLERGNHSLEQLTVSASLEKAALGHSQDMARRNFFNHENPDGASPADRAKAAGYPSSFVGENIAAGYRTPAQVVAGWMTSSGHCANILGSDYHAVGVGYVLEADDTAKLCQGFICYRYWTMTLGNVSDSSPPTASPKLPGSLTFMHRLGTSAVSHHMLSSADTQGNWSASDDASWLSVSPTQGSGPLAIEVSASSAGLGAGSYTATLTITTTAAGASQQVVTIPTRLIISSQLNLALLPMMVR